MKKLYLLLLTLLTITNITIAQPRRVCQVPNNIYKVISHEGKLWLFGTDSLYVSHNDTIDGISKYKYPSISEVLPAPGGIYFISNNYLGGAVLYWSNGTTPGTISIVELDHILGLEIVNGKLIFTGDDATHGIEPWVYSNGTASILKDIYPGPQSSMFLGPEAAIKTANNNLAYFFADDAVHGREFWATDGTTAGTQLLVDLQPGSAHLPVSDYAVNNNSVVFLMHNQTTDIDGNHGMSVYRIVNNDTVSIFSFPPDRDNPYYYIRYINNQHFLFARGYVLGDFDVYISDGTTAGTSSSVFTHFEEEDIDKIIEYQNNYVFSIVWFIADPVTLNFVTVNKSTYGSGSIPSVNNRAAGGDIIALNQYFLYTGGEQNDPNEDFEHYSNLWQTVNGSTIKVADLFPGQGYQFNGVRDFTTVNNKLYFINQVQEVSEFTQNNNPTYLWEYTPVASVVSSAKNFKELKDVRVFPNPASDKLTIDMPQTKASIKLTTIDGYEVYRTATEGGSIQLNLDNLNLGKGMYVLKIEADDSANTYKIIKD